MWCLNNSQLDLLIHCVYSYANTPLKGHSDHLEGQGIPDPLTEWEGRHLTCLMGKSKFSMQDVSW